MNPEPRALEPCALEPCALEPCAVALKEWGATVEALRTGRQILLLRKGGIHDAGGVFSLEHLRFWLLPTAFHQSKPMLKAEHRDLLSAPVSDRSELRLQVLAEVVESWIVGPQHLEALCGGRHIWNEDYLELRLGYKPEHPLGVLALRAFEIAEAHCVQARREYFGCRSWIELQESLPTAGARPILGDAEFGKYLSEWRGLLDGPGMELG